MQPERRWRWLASVVLAGLLAALLSGCGEGAGAEEAASTHVDAPGETTFQRYCYSCHMAGIAGAPRIGDASAWAPRVAQGWATLIDHTRTGIRNMPARGLCRQCSEADLEEALGYMLERSGGLPDDAPADLIDRLYPAESGSGSGAGSEAGPGSDSR